MKLKKTNKTKGIIDLLNNTMLQAVVVGMLLLCVIMFIGVNILYRMQSVYGVSTSMPALNLIGMISFVFNFGVILVISVELIRWFNAKKGERGK
tara:strand:+ start:467 stop:748 length:282 start_codon:yes stop_codon:yes gene_type:complete